MGLDLDIDLRPAIFGPGRARRELAFEISRDLTTADLALALTTNGHSQAPEIKKVTERHHQLAKLLAAGVRSGEAALTCGYTASRVSVLKNSPAMQDLIALYKGEKDEEFFSIQDQLKGLSVDALMELRERMEEDPMQFNTKELLAMQELAFDRTGLPKQTKNETTTNINLTERLNSARLRAKAVQAEIIDAVVISSQEE